MRKFLAASSALAIAFTAPAAFPTVALAATSHPSEAEVCYAAVYQAGIFGSLTECQLAIAAASSGEEPVDVCKDYQDQGLGAEFGVNLGQCVSFLHSYSAPGQQKQGS